MTPTLLNVQISYLTYGSVKSVRNRPWRLVGLKSFQSLLIGILIKRLYILIKNRLVNHY